MEKETMVTLSTAHIQEETSKKLETELFGWYMGLDVYSLSTYEAGGWMIWVDSSADGDDEVPEELTALLKFCKEKQVDWLRLDRDGEIIPELPTFEWKH